MSKLDDDDIITDEMLAQFISEEEIRVTTKRPPGRPKKNPVVVESKANLIEKALGDSIYKMNGNSNNYNWNEEFTTKVMNRLFDWFIAKVDEIFYTSFARTELHITHGQMLKHFSEFPSQWKDTSDELDHITTERIYKKGAAGAINRELAKLALKHLGTKWSDVQTVKVESGLEAELERVYRERLKREGKVE